MSLHTDTLRRLALALSLDWTPSDQGRRGRLSEPGGPFEATVIVGQHAELIGCRLHDSDGTTAETAPPRIGVSLSRPLDVLARDVERRLLRPYRDIYAPAALDRKRRHDARAAQVEATEQHVEQITGARFGRGVRRARTATRFGYRTPSEPYATLRVAVSAPDRVTIEAEGLTETAALAMLRALHPPTDPDPR